MRAASAGHAEDPLIPADWIAGEVAVIGLGRTGVAVGEWLADQGVRVYASDVDDRDDLSAAAQRLRAKAVAVDVGSHDLARIAGAVAVVVSPGVAPLAPPLVAARAAGVPVMAELDLAVRALAGVHLIVVTGTNGKTTTTALTAHMLRTAGVNVEAGGNIGRPLIELVSGDDVADWAVVEASSFQLHDAPNLTPTIGVLTNLAPDHLNRYASVDAYYADKKLLFQNATDDAVWVLNGDDEGVQALAAGVPGARHRWSLLREADGWWDRTSGSLMLGSDRLIPRDHLSMLGDHNVENALAAALAARAAGVPTSHISEALQTFRPPPHRLEPVREVERVLWINDSKATNVTSTSVGLQAMDRPFLLLAGGQVKGEDFGDLLRHLNGCRLVIAYGETAPQLQRAIEPHHELLVVDSLDEAVAAAWEKAEAGDTVLLSPACASFDQFRDYEDRGDTFKRLVLAL